MVSVGNRGQGKRKKEKEERKREEHQQRADDERKNVCTYVAPSTFLWSPFFLFSSLVSSSSGLELYQLSLTWIGPFLVHCSEREPFRL